MVCYKERWCAKTNKTQPHPFARSKWKKSLCDAIGSTAISTRKCHTRMSQALPSPQCHQKSEHDNRDETSDVASTHALKGVNNIVTVSSPNRKDLTTLHGWSYCVLLGEDTFTATVLHTYKICMTCTSKNISRNISCPCLQETSGISVKAVKVTWRWASQRDLQRRSFIEVPGASVTATWQRHAQHIAQHFAQHPPGAGTAIIARL